MLLIQELPENNSLPSKAPDTLLYDGNNQSQSPQTMDAIL